MRICALVPGRYPADPRTVQAMAALSNEGHEVSVVCRGDPGSPTEEYVDGVEVVRVPADASGVRGALDRVRRAATLAAPRWRRGVGTAAGDRGIDAVHVQGLELAPTGLAVGEDRDVPVVLDLDENYPAALPLRRGERSWGERLRHPLSSLGRALTGPRRWRRREGSLVAAADRTLTACEEARARLVRELDADPPSVSVVATTADRRAFDVEGVATAATREPDPVLPGETGADAEPAVEQPPTDATPEAATAAEAVAPPEADTTPAVDATPPSSSESAGRASPGEGPSDDAGFVVGFVGDLDPVYDLETLVRAVGRVASVLPAVDLRLVGGGDEAALDRLEDLAREEGLASSVSITGPADVETVREQLSATDVAVVPYHEGEYAETALPAGVFQAMAMGVPVVVTDADPLRRVVESTGAGRVVPPERPLALTAALRVLHRNPDRARRRGARGRATVRRRYNWARDGRRLRAVYADLAADGRSD